VPGVPGLLPDPVFPRILWPSTSAKYVDFSRIARAKVKLVVTATDIESGEIKSFVEMVR
jgi:hypothetical protein